MENTIFVGLVLMLAASLVVVIVRHYLSDRPDTIEQAVKLGNLNRFRALRKEEINNNTIDNHGNTLLHLAVMTYVKESTDDDRSTRYTMISELLAKGMRDDVPSHFGMTPATYAHRYAKGDTNLVSRFHNPSVNFLSSENLFECLSPGDIRLKNKLINKVNGELELAWRLVHYEFVKHPSESRSELFVRAIERWERDNRTQRG